MDDPTTPNVVKLFPDAPDPEPLLRRWKRLANTFPSVHRAVVGAVVNDRWPAEDLTPGSLDAYLGTVHAHNGLKWSASFLLEVWSPGSVWHHVPRWSPVMAWSAWDSKHRKAWQAWCAEPHFF